MILFVIFYKLADLYPDWHQQAYNLFVDWWGNTSLVLKSITCSEKRGIYFWKWLIDKFTQLDVGVKLAKNFLSIL